MSGSRGSRGRVPNPRNTNSPRPTDDSSPAKRAAGLRKYTCGRYTRWQKPPTGSGSNSRTSAGDRLGDNQRPQTYQQRLELIRDDEDDGNHHESDSDTDNEIDTTHDTSQRDSNYGGGSRGTCQNGSDTPGDTSQRNSNIGGESLGTSQRPSITPIGSRFASRDVHSTIFTIMREHLTKPWITFKRVPLDVRRNMYNCFKTRWTLNSECDQSNFESFINVLKEGYRDIIYNLKVKSTKRAIDDGCDIDNTDYKQFGIIRRYPPDSIPDDVWEQMCDLWDTQSWRDKAKIGKSNRDKNKDKKARHTGGSVGYDEYRVRMKKIFGREPNFREIFLLTHLDKSSKTKLMEGKLNLNSMEGLIFCNDRSKEAYASYLEKMIEKNGLEFSVDDPDVWTRVVQPNLKRKRRVLGIGSSDINFVVTGIASTSSGITQQSDTQVQSQQKIHDLETQIEVERKARLEIEEEIRQEREERQKEREERLEVQRQMKDMKEFMESMRRLNN